MFKLKGFIAVGLLALFGSTAHADVVIDNQSIPSAEIDAISISPTTGNIFVSTFDGYTITPVVVGSGVAISSFTVSQGTVVEGGSVTLSWNTQNAISCSASGGTDGWDGSTVTLPSGTKSVTATTAGVYTFTLTCNGSDAGDTTSSQTILTVTQPGGVAITSFAASPATIAEGDSTLLSWNTENAVSCTPSGGAGGWSALSIGLPTATTTITIATAGTYTFTLTCQDSSGGQAVATTSVVVDVEPDACPTPALSGTTTTWASFWLQQFPDPRYDNRYATINRTGYLAIEFNTGDVVANGKLFTVETTVTDGVRLGAISECPGDFDVAPECDSVWGIGGGLGWATDGYVGACQLQPNTTYYFNVTYTDGVSGATTSCNSSPCITTIQHVRR